MPPRRITADSKNRIRNLRQYKNMPDEEFDALWEQKLTGVEGVTEFERRIERKIESFAEDYDLDDLKANDKLTLRALAQSYITLEDLENYSYRARLDGISEEKILYMEKIGNIMSGLRRDISNMQNDLKITRRIRKGDKEESVINYIEDLKQKAKRFYQSKMSYVFCPKCGMLLGTVWVLYPDSKNKLTFTCKREIILSDEQKEDKHKTYCDTVFTVTTRELMEKRGTNRPELVPESLL